jgi:hypothetical protein
VFSGYLDADKVSRVTTISVLTTSLRKMRRRIAMRPPWTGQVSFNPRIGGLLKGGVLQWRSRKKGMELAYSVGGAVLY